MPRPTHFDLPADDPQRAIDFYGAVFDWQFQKWDGPMEYWLILTGSADEPGINGGLSRRQTPEAGVVNTVEIANLDATVAKAEAAGGQVVVPKGPIPGVGWFAQLRDPEGNLFGLMQPDTTAA